MNFENVYRLHVVGLALGLVGFSVVAMFSFPIGVYLPAFLAMTYIGLIEVASLNSNGNTIHLKNNKRLVSVLSVILIIFAFYSSKKSFEWLVSDAFRNNASIFIKGNRFQEAEYSSMKSIEYNQWNKESYLLSGISKFNLGKVEESIPFFKMAIDIAPFDTLSLLNLSLVYNKTKNIKMESKVLEFILKIDSRNVPAAAKLATLLFKHGQKKDAQIIYLTLKKNFSYFLGRSGFGPYYNVAGPVAILFNDAKYAEYIYQEAIKDSPISDYYIKLASINYFFLDRKDKAIKYYRKALELDPDTLKNKEIKVLIQGYESITKH
jgi:tetratricopeptide (TPR) repeat protein